MIFDLLFRLGPAIRAIYDLGYEPKENFFYELTAEQYVELEKQGKDISKKWFTIIPTNPKHDTPSLLIVDEFEMTALFDAVKHINKLCEEELAKGRLTEFEDRLKYAAKILPDVFTRTTGYEADAKKPNLKIVK
jgi:hypothetical protein